MTDALADIETLALRCRAERARDYIGEAIICYRAGAYRSAIVNTWIAVVFDLVDKVRDLALSGDATAQAINSQYETFLGQIEAGSDQGVRSALDFERTLIQTCKDRLQFFNHQQLRDLERLREDRHQCAHPSFQRPGEPYRPSAEHARVHIRTAVEHVLAQPAVQGRSAIAGLVAVVSSDYFPRDRILAMAALRGTALAGATEPLVRGFADALIFGFSDAGDALFAKAQVASAISALLDLHRGVAEPRIARQLSKLVRDVDDVGLPSVAQLVAGFDEGLWLIDEAARVRLAEFVRVGAQGDVIRAIAGLARHPQIAGAANQRMLGLDIDTLAEAIAAYGVKGLAKERALVLLSEVRNWNRANDVFARLVMPLFDELSRGDVERIVRMPTETAADLPGASGYSAFISQVRRTDMIPAVDLDALLRANRGAYLLPQAE